jgi:aminobenzoyl-glutamate utilization protein B
MVTNSPLRSADILAAIDTRRTDYAALADRIWAMPELRFDEARSSAEQIAVLEQEGFHVTKGVAGMATAFVAEWSSGAGGPVIGFLGEFDALAGLSQEADCLAPKPVEAGGNGHGCGHNLLGTAGMLAAAALKDTLSATGTPATLRYFGCPGEEGGSGKTYMARDGLFSDVDIALCWHPDVFNRVMYESSLANIQAYFRFTGKAAHAAASPQLGRSALDAVELMNVGVNYMREHMPGEARVHYAITNSGGVSPNVVQANAEVLYLVRAPKFDTVEVLFERVKDIARGAALMTQTTMSMEFDRATSNILLNTTLSRAMQRNLDLIGGPGFDADDLDFAARLTEAALTPEDIAASAAQYGQPAEQPVPLHLGILPFAEREGLMSGSTDVADVSWATPTVQCNTACYAIGTPFHTWQTVTQGKRPAAHKGMFLAAQAMALTAADAIADPDLIAEARAEWTKRTGGKPYRAPIPADLQPPTSSSRTKRA